MGHKYPQLTEVMSKTDLMFQQVLRGIEHIFLHLRIFPPPESDLTEDDLK